MCGIFGYIGQKEAAKILIEGLKRLEYRGYDSAGVAVIEQGTDCKHIEYQKRPGKVAEVERYLEASPIAGTIGIAHTRWATHGSPTRENAHPHLSHSGRVAVVHNGIFENYEALRQKLKAKGYAFDSDTDTEVLPHLIEERLKQGDSTLAGATAAALAEVAGAYAVAVLSADHPDEIVVARLSSPLIVGIGEHELFVTSDRLALAGYTETLLYVGDGEVMSLSQNGKISLVGQSVPLSRERFESMHISAEDIGLKGHAHYMHKEIHEQPDAMRNTLRGRIDRARKTVVLGGLTHELERRIADSRKIVLCGCGTALYAAMAGKLFLERLARIPVEVEAASEYRYREPLLGGGDVLIGISQSGETADTQGALQLGQERGALLLGITNREGSSISRQVSAGFYLHVGPERAVASTKAFVGQVVVLMLLALRLAEVRGTVAIERRGALLRALTELPMQLEEVLALEERIRQIAGEYRNVKRIICIGRGYGVPLAYEGALKLREVSYLDAEGYPAGELKHGPLALVEEGVPVIATVLRDSLQEKMLSNIAEVDSRGGHVIAIATRGDSRVLEHATQVLELPDAPEELLPMLAAPVYQLFAYHLGVLRGNDVDQPRNLAKSVTVE